MSNKVFALGKDTSEVYGYKMLSDDDISTLSYEVGNKLDATFESETEAYVGYDLYPTMSSLVGEHPTSGPVEDIVISTLGERLCYMDNTGIAYQFDLVDRYDITTATNMKTLDIGAKLGITPFHPYGFSFSADGMKFFVSNDTHVYEFSTPVRYTVENAQYTGVSLDVSAQIVGDQGTRLDNYQTATECINFNQDGTKMFLTDFSGVTIYEYHLLEGFNLATANFHALAVDLYPLGVERAIEAVKMDPQGQIMFVATSAEIFVFNMSSFDPSTAVLVDSTTLMNADPAEGNQGMGFSPDGLNFYVSDYDTIKQFSLENAWDFGIQSGVVETGKSPTIEPYPENAFFVDNGTKLAIFESRYHTLNVFPIAEPYNAGTTPPFKVYSGSSFSVDDVYINQDGTKMFLMHGGTSEGRGVYQYSLSEPFNPATATRVVGKSLIQYNGTITDGGPSEAFPTSFDFSEDGMKIYTTGHRSHNVVEWNLSEAFDLGTITFNGVSRRFIANTNCVRFGDGGHRVFVTKINSSTIHEYIMETPYDIVNATAGTTFVVESSSSVGKYDFFDDGFRLEVGVTNGDFVSIALSMPYDLDSAIGEYVHSTPDTNDQGQRGVRSVKGDPNKFVIGYGTYGAGVYFSGYLPYGFDGFPGATDAADDIFLSPDGKKVVYLLNGGQFISYDVTIPFEYRSIDVANPLSTITLSDATWISFWMSDDGRKLFVVSSGYRIRQYELSKAWDLSTINLVGEVDASQLRPDSVSVSPDGKIVLLASSGDNGGIVQAVMTTPWDITTLTATGKVYSTGSSFIRSVTAANNGTVLLSVDTSEDKATSYTVTPTKQVITVSENTPTAFDFSSTGETMFFYGDENKWIYKADLETPFDLKTAVFSQEVEEVDGLTEGRIIDMVHKNTERYGVIQALFLLTDENEVVKAYLSGSGFPLTFVETYKIDNTVVSTPKAIDLSDDGRKLFVTDESNGRMVEFNLTEAWSLSGMEPSGDSLAIGVDPKVSSIEVSGGNLYVLGNSTNHVYQYAAGEGSGSGSGSGSGVYTADITGWELPKTPTVGYPVDNIPTLAVSFDATGRVVPCDHSLTDISSVGASEMVYTEQNGRIPMVGDKFTFFAQKGSGGPPSLSQPLSFETKLSANMTVALNEGSSVRFSKDGYYMYILKNDSSNSFTIIQYSLSTPWNPSQARPLGSYTNAAPAGVAYSFEISGDGKTVLILFDNGVKAIHKYSMTTAYDITTVGYTGVGLSDSALSDDPRGITVSDDGMNMYTVSGRSVSHWELPAPFDIFNAQVKSLTGVAVADVGSRLKDVSISSDGMTLYLMDFAPSRSAPKKLYEVSLRTAWNPSPSDVVAEKNINESLAGGENAFAMDMKGDQLFILGDNGSNTMFVSKFTLGVDDELSETVELTNVVDSGGGVYTVTYPNLSITPDPAFKSPVMNKRISLLPPKNHALDSDGKTVVMEYEKVVKAGCRELAFRHNADKTGTIISMTKFELEKEM